MCQTNYNHNGRLFLKVFVIGGRSSLQISYNIIEASMKLVNQHESFYKLNRYKNVYFWLSEIPIYEKKTTIDFLNFINFDQTPIEPLQLLFYSIMVCFPIRQ